MTDNPTDLAAAGRDLADQLEEHGFDGAILRRVIDAHEAALRAARDREAAMQEALEQIWWCASRDGCTDREARGWIEVEARAALCRDIDRRDMHEVAEAGKPALRAARGREAAMREALERAHGRCHRWMPNSEMCTDSPCKCADDAATLANTDTAAQDWRERVKAEGRREGLREAAEACQARPPCPARWRQP